MTTSRRRRRRGNRRTLNGISLTIIGLSAIVFIIVALAGSHSAKQSPSTRQSHSCRDHKLCSGGCQRRAKESFAAASNQGGFTCCRATVRPSATGRDKH